MDTRLVVVPLSGRFFLGLSRSAYLDVDLQTNERVDECERTNTSVAAHARAMNKQTNKQEQENPLWTLTLTSGAAANCSD